MNYKEILEWLKANSTIDEFGHGEIDTEKVLPDIGRIEIADEYGGEGMGDEYWKVYHFSDHGIYVRISGYYRSYDGTTFPITWEGACSEVEPYLVTETRYKDKK